MVLKHSKYDIKNVVYIVFLNTRYIHEIFEDSQKYIWYHCNDSSVLTNTAILVVGADWTWILSDSIRLGLHFLFFDIFP